MVSLWTANPQERAGWKVQAESLRQISANQAYFWFIRVSLWSAGGSGTEQTSFLSQNGKLSFQLACFDRLPWKPPAPCVDWLSLVSPFSWPSKHVVVLVRLWHSVQRCLCKQMRVIFFKLSMIILCFRGLLGVITVSVLPPGQQTWWQNRHAYKPLQPMLVSPSWLINWFELQSCIIVISCEIWCCLPPSDAVWYQVTIGCCHTFAIVFVWLQSKKSGSKSAECVKVIIRCRPMSEKETNDGHKRYFQLRYQLVL